VDRPFSLDSSGNFVGAPGDYGTLTLTNGVYRLTETDQTVWQFRPDLLLDYVQDTNGNRITLGYTNGQLTSLTHSDGQQILIDYNAAGRIADVTDPTGRVTRYVYDASGEHLLQVTEPGNHVTAYSYDSGASLASEHALLSVSYPDGTHDYFTYDSQGRLSTTSQDGGAQLVGYTYDNAGRVTVTDATGRLTYLAFGLSGQLAQVRDGQGRLVNFAYNPAFQFAQLVGPSGENYRYSYDHNGNLTGIENPLRQTDTFTYDPSFNQLASVTDARGNGMQYSYDAHGNLTAISYADGTREAYTYDAHGNVLTSTNRRGQKVTYTYNAAGEVTSKDYSTTPGVVDFVYTYDAAGNLATAMDANGTTRETHDPNTNLLTRIDYPGGHSFTFQYDAAGRRTQRTDQDGNVVNYFYDAAGRLDHMTDGTSALIVQYVYDGAGRLSRKALGNGVYTTYTYDAAGNVLDLVNDKPDGSILSLYDYTYDASGQQTSMTTLDGTYLYGYDPLGQLTSVTYPDGHVVIYAYDAAGNRTQVDDNGTTTAYTSNALNQYVTVGGGTYAYDADGNMTSKTEGAVTTTYTYDAENRLIGVASPTDTWAYAYDAFGNQVAAKHNGVATNYVLDPTGMRTVAAEYDGAGNLLGRYDQGYGLVSRTSTTNSPTYYTFSGIGNTSELTDSTGSVLNSYAYDPFGVSHSKSEIVPNPFQNVGEFGVMSQENGLQLMRAREYDPTQGRFLQIDPIGIAGSLNTYNYSLSNPVQLIDPTGLSAGEIREKVGEKVRDKIVDYIGGLFNEGLGNLVSDLNVATRNNEATFNDPENDQFGNNSTVTVFPRLQLEGHLLEFGVRARDRRETPCRCWNTPKPKSCWPTPRSAQRPSVTARST
jgi:RHS repeat-associated protein